MQDLYNPWRGEGLPQAGPLPLSDPAPVSALLAQCPAHAPTPLVHAPDVAARAGVGAVYIKDERQRMGLGSFKALGASYVIARDAVARQSLDISTALEGCVYVTASAGNHGLSVAAGARLFSARAVIYLSQTVPEAFARRLEAYGAKVMRAGADYEASMEAAALAAAQNGWTLLSDSTWEGATEQGLRVMEGYLQMAHEAAEQIPTPPTHIFLQAGVGGLAGAVAAYARRRWGDAPQICVVEPQAAPALFDSIRAGQLVTSTGPVSAMGRLDCKTPSLVALQGLARDADRFLLISEEEAAQAVAQLAELGLATTPSGGAGLAALFAGASCTSEACVLAILSEGREDG